jgi:hypothetical protein
MIKRFKIHMVKIVLGWIRHGLRDNTLGHWLIIVHENVTKSLQDIVMISGLYGKWIKRRLNSGNVCYHSVQSLVFPSVVKKSKNENVQDYNFACGFVWARNLSSDTKGRT